MDDTPQHCAATTHCVYRKTPSPLTGYTCTMPTPSHAGHGGTLQNATLPSSKRPSLRPTWALLYVFTSTGISPTLGVLAKHHQYTHHQYAQPQVGCVAPADSAKVWGRLCGHRHTGATIIPTPVWQRLCDGTGRCVVGRWCVYVRDLQPHKRSPPGPNTAFCNAVMLAKPNATFIQRYLGNYAAYTGAWYAGKWYHHPWHL